MKIYLESNLNYLNKLIPHYEYEDRVDYWKDKILNGENRPIVADKKDLYRVVDGNHMLAAYKSLNQLDRIEVYAVDRIDFLNRAAEIGESNALSEMIDERTAEKIV